jgi:3'-phosphoadenosine 5'-phosphosulfate sulfotransferase (PAPS reductase)/FAD synthetase
MLKLFKKLEVYDYPGEYLDQGRGKKLTQVRLQETVTFKEKVERSQTLIRDAYKVYGDALVVANSLGKDSVAVWDLAKKQ